MDTPELCLLPPGVTKLGFLSCSRSGTLRRDKSPGASGLLPAQADKALVAKKAKAGGWPGAEKVQLKDLL